MIDGPKEVLGVVKAPTVAAEETKSARVVRVVAVFFRVIMLLLCIIIRGPHREHLGCTAAPWVDLGSWLRCLFTPFRVMCLLHRKN